MYKLYNTFNDFTSNIDDFFKKSCPNIKKTQLNFLSSIIFGLISSESVVTSNIAKKIASNYNIKFDSITKRIRRFFNNNNYNFYSIYDSIITYVISNFNFKHKDVHIAFDHMFKKDNFTTFMFSLRIGKQSIPLWFRCFKSDHDPNAFKESLIIEGINYCINLFKNFDCNLIFLADRGFRSASLIDYIHQKHCFYVIRITGDIKIKYYDIKEKMYVFRRANEIASYAYHGTYFKDALYTKKEVKTNFVISKSKDLEEPWFLITNLPPNKAARDYAKRFGAIEFLFKSQKSNGFRLESTTTKNLKAYETLYAIVCICCLWLSICGSYYIKNKNSLYKNKVTIRTIYKYKNGSIKKAISIFKIGLILFNKAIYNTRFIKLPYNFKLYDI